MTALPVLDLGAALAPVDELLRAVQAALGVLAGLARLMASSPALLRGYLELNPALDDGVFDVRMREQVALVVAGESGCAYCLSAHAHFDGHAVKLSAADFDEARRLTSSDPRVRAVLMFPRP